LASLALALDGQFGIHDPSTVVRCDGKFYTYGTGGSSLVSEDGWTWKRGTTLPRRGLAPDVIHIGDRYYVNAAANIGAQPKAAINMIWNKTLDPDSPDYKREEGGVVASSDGVEDCNAIDPGVFLDPTAGCGWSMAPISATSGWSNSIPRLASGATPTISPATSPSTAKPAT
jgi:arabinan endo-1,5-alpha-L-arabinosidase